MSSEKKKRGLGKGIESLIEDFEYDVQVENVINKSISEDRDPDKVKVMMIPMDKIRTNPNQPRKTFDEESLNGLAISIESQGVLQPITVEEIAPGEFSIISGERRFRAAQIAKLDKIPAQIVNFSEIQRLEASLIENIQRENLNAIEEAAGYQFLIERSGYTQEELGQKIGKSRSAIANSLRLLLLPDEIKDDIITGAMTAGHARAILSLRNPLDRTLLREKILNNDLSVREAEALAESLNKGHKAEPLKKNKRVLSPEMSEIEEKFTSALKAKCQVKGSVKRGTVTIRYQSTADLERIYAMFSSGSELFDE